MFCGGVAANAILLGTSRLARAADEIPAPLQAELLTRLAAYDKNMKARSPERVATVVVVKAGDVDSERAGALLVAALGRFDRVGSLPHHVSKMAYPGATPLVESCKANHVGLVVISPALAFDVAAIRTAFDGTDILTAAPNAEMTRLGIVLGFELVSSRPKLFINLTQAGKQNVSLPSDILKLMTVFR